MVLDPFCGSGTVGVEAKLQGRSSVNFDINAGAIELTAAKLNRLDDNEIYAAVTYLLSEKEREKEEAEKDLEKIRIEKDKEKLRARLESLREPEKQKETNHVVAFNDARRLPLKSESIDAVITDIPYSGMIEYSNHERDLSVLDYKGFLEGIRRAFEEVYRVLKKGKYFILFTADYRIGAARKIIPVHANAISICDDIGFTLFDLYVWRYYRSGGFRPFGAKPYQAMNVHSYILCFYKPKGDEEDKANRPIRYRPRLKEKLRNGSEVRKGHLF